MSTELTANINQAQCIVEKGHFAKTVYHNICTGRVTEVPWAPGDWLGFGILCFVFGLLFLVFCAFMATKTS